MPISSFLIRALLPSAAAAAATYQNGVYQIPLQQVHNQGYGVQCSVGTPPQSMTIPIDLGSSILTLPSSKLCKDYGCSGSGSYDNSTSSTCKWFRGEASDLVFKGVGSLLTDTVHIGDLLVKNLIFGLLDNGSGSSSYAPPASYAQPASGSQPAYTLPKPASGSQPAYAPPQPASGSQPAYTLPSASGPVSHPPPASYSQPSYSAPNSYTPAGQTGLLGLGLPCLAGKQCQGSQSFLQQLFELKQITARAFSLYFDATNAAGILLIGAFDKSKQLGSVFELKLVQSTVASVEKQVTLGNLVKVVKITLQTLNSDGKTYSTMPYSYPDNTYMPLDTNSLLWSLPTEIFTLVAQHFGIQEADAAGNLPVDCKYQTPTKDSLNMDFGEGNILPLSLHKLVTKGEDGTCRLPISGNGQSLGLGFLNQVLTVVNYETHTVKISQVSHTTGSHIIKL